MSVKRAFSAPKPFVREPLAVAEVAEKTPKVLLLLSGSGTAKEGEVFASVLAPGRCSIVRILFSTSEKCVVEITASSAKTEVSTVRLITLEKGLNKLRPKDFMADEGDVIKLRVKEGGSVELLYSVIFGVD